MKKIVFYLLICVFSVALVGCETHDEEPTPEPNPITKPTTSQQKIVGRWLCYKDAYGEPWEKPLLYCFDSDGTGFEWFQDEPYSDRWIFSYYITESELCLFDEWDAHRLSYTFSDDGNTLTIYGMDDNDMRVLRLSKQ